LINDPFSLATSFTVMLVQTGPSEMLQVTIMEKADGDVEISNIVEIARRPQ
jgi:hypothetical protein